MRARDIRRAAAIMREGGVIAYPTEGCFGLGCDPRNQRAVYRILSLKRRSPALGLILIASSLEQLKPYLDPAADRLLAAPLATWPGPYTWVLPASRWAPRLITGGRPSIAVRITARPDARLLCRLFRGAIVSTSANPHGRPPATTPGQVRFYFGNRIDAVVPGFTARTASPSEIRDAATGSVLRSGS